MSHPTPPADPQAHGATEAAPAEVARRAPRPPALTAESPRSYRTPDLDALVTALEAHGAEQLNPAPAEAARLSYGGGLALCYARGSVVVGGTTPRALLQLLDKWSGQNAPAAALLTRRGPNSWHAADLPALLAALDAHPELSKWDPPPGFDARAKNEAARYYHRPAGVRGRVISSAIVVSFDGWTRCSGDAPQRAAHVLDAIAAEASPPDEAVPEPEALQLALFAEVAR
jgi:hypothetical protein